MSKPNFLISKYQLFKITDQGVRLPDDLKNIIEQSIFNKLESEYYTLLDFLKYIKHDQPNNYPPGVIPFIEGDNIKDALSYIEKMEQLGWISSDIINLNTNHGIDIVINTIRYTLNNLDKLARLRGKEIEPIVKKLFVDYHDIMKGIVHAFDYEFYVTHYGDVLESILDVLENNNMDDLASSF